MTRQERHGPCGGGPGESHGGPDDRHCLVCIDKTCRYNQPDPMTVQEQRLPAPSWGCKRCREILTGQAWDDTFDEGWRAAEVAVLDQLRGRSRRRAHALLEGLRINRRNGDPRRPEPSP